MLLDAVECAESQKELTPQLAPDLTSSIMESAFAVGQPSSEDKT